MEGPSGRLALHHFPTKGSLEEAERNLRKRLAPALRRQPGFVVGYWALVKGDDSGISFTVAVDEEHQQAAVQAINAVPLLPGQEPSRLPSPVEVYSCDVVDDSPGAAEPRSARLAWLGANVNGDLEEERRWVVGEMGPFLRSLPGLAHAYMLREPRTGERFSLTFWGSEEAMRGSEEAVGRWSREQAVKGHRPAMRPERVLTFEVFLYVPAEQEEHPAAGG